MDDDCEGVLLQDAVLILRYKEPCNKTVVHSKRWMLLYIHMCHTTHLSLAA